ncbi:MAG: GHKL domain-containing protein [Clostridia bacterium]|nr:GHKL domain-containing protein [Clostridia bacterium]
MQNRKRKRFGVKSIKNVAEKYGGTATFSREGNLFVLTVLFV